VSRLVEDGNLARLPQFGIVTNGASRHSAEMVDYCRQHNIAVTVSLDGPKYIHDALRNTAHGAGTFDAVSMTIESLLRTGLPIAIEMVYTSLHIDKECTIVDLFEFVETLGAKKLIFHTAYPPAPPELCPFDDDHFGRLVRFHVDAVDWWFNSLLGGSLTLKDVYFKDLLVPLLEGGGAGVAGGDCPAGSRDLAVAPNGDVYSCHLLYGMSQFRLGNLLLPGCRLRMETELPLKAGDLPQCADCFARYWCQPCGALNLNWGNAWIAPERECALRRAVVSRLGELAFAYLVIPSNAIIDILRQAVGSKSACASKTLPILERAEQYWSVRGLKTPCS
jgi:radical SAM protein with 4Fe4S-binding SPASM domain